MEWVRGEPIGCGGFSTVSLAIPRNASSQYPSLMVAKSCDAYDSALLEHEKDVLNQLQGCPEIIRCFGSDQSFENGQRLCNLLLEYAPGGSLASLVKKSVSGFLKEADVKNYTRSILKGLCYIHAKGFVHCDIKLQNLLLFDNGEVKIADFGLVRKTGQAEQGRMEIRGTPLYMSPESVNDNEYESPCDIWALGCAVVEMLTGKPAWNCKPETSIMALLIRIGVGDELPITPEDLSEEGKDFLSKCFVKDPSKRWTAEMLLNHPFITDDNTVSLKDGEELSTSPRCPFDFPKWVSIHSSPMPTCFIREEKSRFDSLFSTCSSSPSERIHQLVCDHVFKWSDFGSWVTVR